VAQGDTIVLSRPYLSNELLAIRCSDGSTRWQLSIGDPKRDFLLALGRGAIRSAFNPVARAVLGLNSVVRARATRSSVIAPPFLTGELTVIAAGSGDVIAVDTRTGQDVWRVPLHGDGAKEESASKFEHRLAATSSADMLYVGTSRQDDGEPGELAAVRIPDGNILWRTSAAAECNSPAGDWRAPPLLAGGELWATLTNRRFLDDSESTVICVLDAKTGRLLARASLPEPSGHLASLGTTIVFVGQEAVWGYAGRSRGDERTIS